MPRLPIALAALAVVAVATACSGDDGTTTTAVATTATPTSTTVAVVTTTTAPPTTTAAPTTAPPPTSTTEATDAGVVIDVVITDDGIEADDRYEVPLGEDVTIRATSTFEDELHVHGYDLLLPLAPDQTAELTFVADVPGIFEVELEAAQIPLFELVVE